MENRLASTTTYPELLELGPGQWGQEGQEGPAILQVWKSGSIPGKPNSPGFHILFEPWAFPSYQSSTWEVPGVQSADTKPPPPSAPHLVNYPINLHRDDEVSIAHWL